MEWRWLEAGSSIALFVVSALAGGATGQAVRVLDDPRAVVTIGLIGAVIVVTVLIGAKRRRWLENPYW